MKAERSAEKLFLIGVAAVPLLVVNGSVHAFNEPKLAVLLLMLAVCLGDLLRRPGAMFLLGPTQIGLSLLLLTQLASLTGVQNSGLALNALSYELTLLIVPLWVANSSLSSRELGIVLVPTVSIIIVGALSTMLLGISISYYSPFGSTVGLKNSLSVYLAQLLPLLLAIGIHLHQHRNRWTPALTAMIGVVVVALLWVVFANRTRSAWWMIVFYISAMGLLAVRRNPRQWRAVWAGLLAAAAAAATLCYAVPGRLKWNSQTPYFDSLTTLASFEHSNGRDQLWRVGLEIIGSNPWTGVGLGNYPALWQPFIALTEVDPKVFAILRGDLPLFNDYLQAGTEGGIVALAVFVTTLFAIPLYRLQRVGRDVDPLTACAILCCAATAIDALFDSPFSRPESVLTFALACGLVERQVESRRVSTTAVGRGIILSLCITTLSLSALLGGAVVLRRHWTTSGNTESLATAWRLWPTSWQWRADEGVALASHPDVDELVAMRMRSWPNDPESYLLLGVVRAEQRRFTDAIDAYRRAMITVPGGRCFRRAHIRYMAMLARPDYPASAPRLTDAELAHCPAEK